MNVKLQFTMHYADTTGNAANCVYPHSISVSDEITFRTAVAHDHVYATFKNNRRSTENFISANALPVDCDNDHSDNPADWVTPKDIAEAFPGVAFAVHYSRNHLKPKGGKTARPRFHIVFPIELVMNADEYARLKERVRERFPFIDKNAMDAARFFFGTEDPNVEFLDGNLTLTEFLLNADSEEFLMRDAIIPEGSRNATLSKYAGKIIKRYGDTDEAFALFLKKAECCEPPLEDAELHGIWKSARTFYKRVESEPNYITPEQYNSATTLKPRDFSDVGQAEVLAREYIETLRYSSATDYLYFNGRYWEESKPRAQAVAQKLTLRQLIEAERMVAESKKKLDECGASTLLLSMSAKKAADIFSDEQTTAYEEYQEARKYLSFVINRRESKNITATLREARPMLEINPADLDADGFLLNTPKATYDLRLGLSGEIAHHATDHITKITSVSPGDTGKDEWLEMLNTTFCGDSTLIDYVQRIVGLAAIGKVYCEALIIAYGDGRNGKSTFWNLISRVLGTYSGNISADTLTVGCRRNVKPELAEAKGKRLLIAAELEEGTRLNTSTVKQLASTDEIFAEKKYKDPIRFSPSHTLVLYTNHLPKVGATDEGIWRRLLVIPFNAKIESAKDIKNYADYLLSHCGEAVLSWIIEGAQKIIAENFHLNPPVCVQNAVAAYRENNNWLNLFLNECCEKGEGLKERSGDLYSAYRNFCMRSGEYTRSTTDFYTAIDTAGYRRQKSRTGSFVYGLQLKQGAEEDFL